MAQARDRAGLYARESWLDLYPRMARPLPQGDPPGRSRADCDHLVDADEKRLHTFEEMRHAGEGWLSATSENMTMHIDMASRKTAAFPPDIRARIGAILARHA